MYSQHCSHIYTKWTESRNQVCTATYFSFLVGNAQVLLIISMMALFTVQPFFLLEVYDGEEEVMWPRK